MGSRSVHPKQHLDLLNHFLHSEAEMSRLTDRLQANSQTDRDTANIGNNSLNLMHSMQPKNQMQVYCFLESY